MKIVAVVLAAGASKRLGRAKQTLVLGNELLVERAVRVAGEAGLTPVIVVTNAAETFGKNLQQRGCILAVNGEAEEGMASSIRCGIEMARTLDAIGAVMMTCDQPGVTASHLLALAADPEVVTASEYGGRKGVPAYFPAAAFDALLALRGDAGARELLRGARSVLNEALAVDVDTEEDYRAAQTMFDI